MTHFNLEGLPPLQFPVSQYSQALSSKPFFSFKDFNCRKEAIEEGYLIDVSSLSNTFKAEISITREVWELYVLVNSHDLFSQQFRAISLLVQARIAIKQADPHVTEVFFEVKCFPRRSQSYLTKIRLWIVVSPGDSNEPVLTIMLDTQHGESL